MVRGARFTANSRRATGSCGCIQSRRTGSSRRRDLRARRQPWSRSSSTMSMPTSATHPRAAPTFGMRPWTSRTDTASSAPSTWKATCGRSCDHSIDIRRFTMSKVTPYLCCKNAVAALDFYKAAFGADETMRMVDESGKVGHAEMKIDDAVFMLSDEWPEGGVFSPETLGGTPLSLHLQVTNVDEFFARALTAGATEERGVQDQAYGERSGVLKDPFGHRWFIGTPIEGFGMD